MAPPCIKPCMHIRIIIMCIFLPSSFQFAHCSVKGVSLTMFILAVLGNTTYSLGILLYSQDRRFIIQTLPWIIGSAGTLCLDFIVSYTNYSMVYNYTHNEKHFKSA